MYFIFDLETTGLPLTRGFRIYDSPYRFDSFSNARLVEIGYLIVDASMKVVVERSILIRPDEDFRIENDHIHGITHHHAMTHGVSFSEMAQALSSDLLKWPCHTLVAHNISFDYHVLLANLIMHSRFRTTVMKLMHMKQTCTMAIGRWFLRAPRYPKLSVLYKELTGEEWVQTHRALDDVKACMKCFVHMKQNTRWPTPSESTIY